MRPAMVASERPSTAQRAANAARSCRSGNRTADMRTPSVQTTARAIGSYRAAIAPGGQGGLVAGEGDGGCRGDGGARIRHQVPHAVHEARCPSEQARGWRDPDTHEPGLLGRARAGRGRGLGRASPCRGRRALVLSTSRRRVGRTPCPNRPPLSRIATVPASARLLYGPDPGHGSSEHRSAGTAQRSALRHSRAFPGGPDHASGRGEWSALLGARRRQGMAWRGVLSAVTRASGARVPHGGGSAPRARRTRNQTAHHWAAPTSTST